MVKNFKHIILSSNEDWPVHLDPDDRRFLVLRVSENHKEDHKYFEEIENQLKSGGYEALLHDLLNENLTNFKPRELPPSTDAFDIKMRSANSVHRYIYEALDAGHFSLESPENQATFEWELGISKDDLYKDYSAWCAVNGEARVQKIIFCKTFKKLIPSSRDKRTGGINARQRYFTFASLDKTREEFCKIFKEDFRRIFGNEEK